MKTAGKSLLLASLVLMIADFALAQKPKINNAKVQELSASGGLKAAIDSLLERQGGPLWLGYRIPTAAKERSMCCFDSWENHRTSGECCLGCRLESARENSFSGTSSDCSSPEPLPYAFVFMRLESKQVQRVRVFSADCPLDFAGLPLYWLEEVKPEESINLLVGLASKADAESDWGDHGQHPQRQAVMAIAMHDTPAADQALEKLIQPGQPQRVRENAAFWLGVERGKKGAEVLLKHKDDPDDGFRRKLTFALSQNKQPEALQALIKMARNDPSPEVRSQAIFWMAQIGGRKEAEQITAAIENDPETEVKKKAVFALSQLHDGEAVPLLINLARTNKNPVVRKQAIFWLGQSHDPRALDFLEEILSK